jgi:beta-phosphoglucomutase-like phosphatase (HAD superfamily)
MASAMGLCFDCLILDHDDTAVDSTAAVHYPAHVEAMRVLRPGLQPVDLEGWFLKNFHPGVMGYLSGELGLSARELEVEYGIWRAFTTSRTAPFFAGFLETLREYRGRGGKIVVASHSESDLILRDYRSADGLPLLPDLVYGWDADEQRRKPSPWPVQEALRRLAIPPARALIVDDLKPGVLMGQRTGVAAAAAGWAHCIPAIREYMQSSCLAYFESVGEFRDFILA